MGSMAYTNLGHPERSTSFDHDVAVAEAKAGGSPDRREPEVQAMPDRLVRAVQTARRRRDALFSPDLFADPAWDMLLELYALHLEEKRVSVSSLCIAAYVPATTALRWVSKLEEEGLAVRSEDTTDGRRSWIELSPEGIERMRRYFEMLPLASISV